MVDLFIPFTPEEEVMAEWNAFYQNEEDDEEQEEGDESGGRCKHNTLPSIHSSSTYTYILWLSCVLIQSCLCVVLIVDRLCNCNAEQLGENHCIVLIA